MSGTALRRCIALIFVAVSTGEPMDITKPPTCSSAISCRTRSQPAVPSGVKSPNTCGQTSCAARSRGLSVVRTESAQRSADDERPAKATLRDMDAHAAIRTVSVSAAAIVRVLPADRALLAGVDILGRARAKEECLHVLRQESPRLRIHDVEAVVIDQHRLLTHPLCPAFLTDRCDNPRADRTREWRALESGARLTTTNASYVSQNSRPPRALRARVLHLREAEHLQQPDIEPTDVELVPFRLELR